MLKFSNPVKLLMAIAGLAVIYMLLNGESDAVAKTAKKPKLTSASKLKMPEGISKEDYDATFDALQEEPKNAFTPLVVSTRGARQSSEPASLNAIPSDWTAGEAGWTFTGVVETDGRRQALLENKSSGNGVFLNIGEHWKQLTVESIGESFMIITGPTGVTRTIRLDDGETQVGTMSGNNGNQPMSPLGGAITNRFEISPEQQPSGRAGRRAVLPPVGGVNE
ncbi:MAG: hypothetical protein K8R88_13585 [Armatimonadetes bacterium]|nr:hypothetical protein [Armatimonadota bacterium]